MNMMQSIKVAVMGSDPFHVAIVGGSWQTYKYTTNTLGHSVLFFVFLPLKVEKHFSCNKVSNKFGE